jgi:hypothetical protein
VGGCGLDSSVPGEVPLTGFCEHGNEPSGSTKGGEFLDHLSGYSFSRTLLFGVI